MDKRTTTSGAGLILKLPWDRDNRRKFERIRVLVPCKLIAGDKTFLGKTYDIGLGGARFDAGLEPDLPNQVLEDFGNLHLLLPEIEIVIHSKILRAASTFVALQFTTENPTETMKILKDFLETQVSYINL
ncbi:MAG: PilZ domain-containing protein [Deltaproteobacteria bacterium]|nr:PilZ domain-containing protein [Deltaproteobacteria bacterium]MBT6433172.1 PilZ domain-containing protein [Deltaproteobacteria bacterium]MBT6488459.1 PilZ domain-containing protein [Deltaproteobacteria bacterium]